MDGQTRQLRPSGSRTTPTSTHLWRMVLPLHRGQRQHRRKMSLTHRQYHLTPQPRPPPQLQRLWNRHRKTEIRRSVRGTMTRRRNSGRSESGRRRKRRRRGSPNRRSLTIIASNALKFLASQGARSPQSFFICGYYLKALVSYVT